MTETLIRPFAAIRPAPGRAADIAAPPYDVVTIEEARAHAAGRPNDFFHVSRPEIDLPDGTDPHGDTAYAQAARAMRQMLDSGVLVRDAVPGYSVYRISVDDHIQTGIAGAVPVSCYESGRVRRHEHTRPDKELDRARQIEAVSAHTGLVFVTHRPDAGVAAVCEAVMDGPPDAEAEVSGALHQVWRVSGAALIDRLTLAFAAMPAIYIADGHHRSAAAVRVAGWRRAEGRSGGEDFLIVSFPADQVRILDYNRVVADLGDGTGGTREPESFLSAVGERFAVAPADGPVRPDRRATFGLFVADRWYHLSLREPVAATAGPLDRLDVKVLSERLLEPVLGIIDPRTDRRIDFVGGARGLDGLEARVRSGPWAAAFSLYPTALEDLMAVADAGEVMPPKSTWFEPKLADGLLALPLDQ